MAKRLDTGLRNVKQLKLMCSDSDSDEDEPPKKEKQKQTEMRGKDKLTDIVIDHVQYYFQVSLNRKVDTYQVE